MEEVGKCIGIEAITEGKQWDMVAISAKNDEDCLMVLNRLDKLVPASDINIETNAAEHL